MKKKILFGFFSFITIVFAVSYLRREALMNADNSATVREKDKTLNTMDASGDGVIWESLSGHFMTIE